MSEQATIQTGRRLVLAMAVMAAMPVIALAQYQVQGSTGRLLDANNRLGSSGVNDARQGAGGYSADDVVYGNVTRGRQFRGQVNSKDPTAFRGDLTTPSDNLTRDAGPGAYQRGGVNEQFTGQAFFGDQRGVRPPEGFRQLTPGSPGTFQVQQPTYRIPGDLRMDDTVPNPDMSLSRPTQYILPGMSVANEGLDTTANTMYQVPLVPGAEPDMMPSRDLLRRLNLDESRIREMKQELQDSEQQGQGEQGGQGGQKPTNPADLTVAPETPLNDPLNSSVRSDVAAQQISGSIDTQQSLRQSLLTANTAARQSSQYAELRNRLSRFDKRREMNDEEASRQFQQDWLAAQQKAKQEKEQQARAEQQPNPGEQPAKPAKLPDAKEEAEMENEGQPDRRRMAVARQQSDGRVEGILPPQPDIPLKITSFADGVKATGLKKLLTDAELAMQKGQFTSALDNYDAAAAVAPNNPLIMVARSIAELGAGYYARAQIHLEQALSMDPALLMARYDLKTFYGEDRLGYIVKDLKDLSQAEARQSRPMFLLAFIAYNMDLKNGKGGDLAADWLNVAEQRGGSKEFYDKLREYWKVSPEPKKEAAVMPGQPVPAPVPAPSPAPAPSLQAGNK